MPDTGGGCLEITNMSKNNYGIFYFSQLYPVPSQAKANGSVRLDKGKTLKLYPVVLCDFRSETDMELKVWFCNISREGYFLVMEKLAASVGFSERAYLWGTDIAAKNPNLAKSCARIIISSRNDQIQILYYTDHYSYLLHSGIIGDEEMKKLSDKEKDQKLWDALKKERLKKLK